MNIALSGSQPRNTALDGLRGLAATAVIFYHAILGLDLGAISRVLAVPLISMRDAYDRLAKLALILLNGETAIVIFFVLSGAVLFESLKHSDGSHLRICWAFAVRRMFRIYPVLILSLCLYAISYYFFLDRTIDLGAFLVNATLYDSLIIGPSWTLNVEVIGTALILLCFLAYRRQREIGLLVTGVAICLLLRLQIFRECFVYFRPYAITLLFGMLIPTRIGAGLCRRLPSSSWIAFLLTMMLAKHVVPIGARTSSMIQEISAALLVGQIYYQRAPGLQRLLTNRVVHMLGTVSYSLYLLNTLFLLVAFDLISHYGITFDNPLIAGLLLGVVVTLLTVPLAWASFKLVEVPGIALGRKLLGAPRRPELPSGSVAPGVPRPF